MPDKEEFLLILSGIWNPASGICSP